MGTVLVDVDEGRRVATLTLNQPERRNSLTLDAVHAIVAALDELESRDDVGALVITGAPPAFCAGADLSHLGGSRDSGIRQIYAGFLRVARSTLPTVAAVNGAAVGAGMNLALACDVRLAGRRAKFDTRFLQLGLHPGGGHTWMLQRIVGPQAAAAMVLFGEVYDGEQAAAVGLALRCVDDDDLLAHARDLAARAAAAPKALAARAKATIASMSSVHDHDRAVDIELEAQVWSLSQPEFAERLAALQSQISTKR
jgi:enoyl-CoA hydratase